MDGVLPKPGLLSLPPNGEGDLWRSAVVVAPDGDGLLPKRPVGCVRKGEAVGGAPKPPKAGVALEAKMLEALALLDGGAFAKRLVVLVLLDGAGLPKRLVLLDGGGLKRVLEPLAVLDEAILEPKRPVPGVVAKIEVEPNPPPLEGGSNRLLVDVLGAGAWVLVDPKADALLVGAGLEPNKPVADPNPPAPAVLVLVFGTLLAEAGAAVVDPMADALVVDACPGTNKAPSDPSVLEVLPVDTDLELPKPPTLGAVAAVEALAEAGRVVKLREGCGEVVAVAVVELEVEVVLGVVGAVPNEKGLVVLLAGVGVGFEAGALAVGRAAVAPNPENKLGAVFGALFAEAGRTAVLPVVVVLPAGAAVAPKSPPVETVVVGAVGAAVVAAVVACGGGGGAGGRNGAGGYPCVGAPG